MKIDIYIYTYINLIINRGKYIITLFFIIFNIILVYIRRYYIINAYK